MVEEKGVLGSFVQDALNGLGETSDEDDQNDQKEKDSGDASEKYIKWFSELDNSRASIAGGKGASLAEMYNSRFPVPPGFVVATDAFDYFIRENDLKEKINSILESMNVEDTEELDKKSNEIRSLIEKAKMPEDLGVEIIEAYHILGSEEIQEQGISEDALNILRHAQEPIFVSVRSSATTEDLEDASFAGQQDSFLNIKGDRNLISNIKKCFASLYTARAIYYRNKKGFKESPLIAVVVQKMIDSEKSGVVFSRNPINLSEDILIEAVYGLGEGVVSGKILPDNYTVSRDLDIKNIKASDKKIAIVRNSSGQNEVVRLSGDRSMSQVLTHGQILEVADYAIKLEEHYRKPQDIEFAVESNKVYIVQSRPITTLKEREKQGVISGNVILTGTGASPGIGVGVVKIIKTGEDLSKIRRGDVLVAEMTNPDMIVAMEKSVAIVTNEGGATSHAAIVSREMGTPCVVGTEEATKVLKEGMRITVDGLTGKIYEGEVSETIESEIKPIMEPERIKLKVIVDLPDFAKRAAESEIDSVGLARLEGIIAGSGKHPLSYEKEGKLDEYTELLKEGIEKISESFDSIWVRSSDIRTDEFSSLKGAPEREINPMLGMHGIRFSLKHPEILKAELKAIKEVAEKDPRKEFGVMLPQVISIEEVKKAKELFNEIKTDNMRFGVTIETPAAVQIIEDICNEVDFVSLGTNDLTQFTLGVDRNDEDLQDLYDEFHPAIYSQIKRVLGACRRNKVETSICGQAGSKKEMVEFLFKKGINSISVHADAAYDISVLIKDLEEEREKIFQERKDNFENKFNRQNEKGRLLEKDGDKRDGEDVDEFPVAPSPVDNQEDMHQEEVHKNEPDSKGYEEEDKREEISEEIKEVSEDGRLLEKDGDKRDSEYISDYQENIGPIKPLDNLDRIEKKSEEIELARDEKELEEMKEEDEEASKEKFEVQRVIDELDDNKSEKKEESYEDDDKREKRDEKEDVYTNLLDDEKSENEGDGDKKDDEESENEGDGDKRDSEDEEEEEDSEGDGGSDTGVSEGDGGSDTGVSEGIGVYKPDEEERKQEYNYFDD